MKSAFARLAALLLAMMLVLTGCNLIEVDQVAVANKERAEIEKDYAAVMAEYDGGVVTKFDVFAPFYSNYSYMAQMYSSFGMELTSDIANEMLQEAVAAELTDRAIAIEFEKRGLPLSKTEEELRAEANESYDGSYAYYLEMVEGDTDEAKAAYAELALYTEGMTRDRLYGIVAAQYRAEELQAAVEAEITEVSEEDLRAAYEARLAEDEAAYTETPSMYEEDISSGESAVCWVPEGYRTVKHVLIIPEEAVLQAVVDARTAYEAAEAVADETELEALKAAIVSAEAACLESVKADVDQIYEKLAEGRSFDAVMEVFGEDPGMQSEPNKSTGYYVREDSTLWDPNFTAGAMALEKVGDYSAEPVITSSGVHIISYNADVISGPVAFEEVRDALYDQTLEAKRIEHYETQLQSWVSAINPVYHMDAWVIE